MVLYSKLQRKGQHQLNYEKYILYCENLVEMHFVHFHHIYNSTWT